MTRPREAESLDRRELPASDGDDEALAEPERSRRRRWPWIVLAVPLVGALAAVIEVRTSWLQAHVAADWSEEIGYSVEPGPAALAARPEDGPYDRRLGYASLPELLPALESRGFDIVAQARVTPRFAEARDLGLFPLYREKAQAGLELLDRSGSSLYRTRHPETIYEGFDAIPPLVVRTLLFIENRELLDAGPRFRNPAVEWDRLLGSVVALFARRMGAEGSVSGASTLATQIEKFRHSERGITTSPREKLRQMATASVRAYIDGPRTSGTRRRIVLDYLNSVPLAAVAGHGEVIGLNDGLWAWYGLEAARVNALLSGCHPGLPSDVEATGTAPDAGPAVEPDAPGACDSGDPPVGEETAGAYRAVLNLMLAQRRPSFYLAQPAGHEALHRLSDVYLGLMRESGWIPPALEEAVRPVRVDPRPRAPESPVASFRNRKAATAARKRLLDLTGRDRLYELDRLDLTVRTTIDRPTQDSVARLLRRLESPSYVEAAGLAASRLLDRGDPAKVLYSFVLYEATPAGNMIRVQTDNFDGPFDLNQSSRLELGSTAKLRTLVTYLEVVERLHGELAGLDSERRRAVSDSLSDPLTRWAVGVLDRRLDATVPDMLEAAMERPYSASPAERFFTGGGTHVFRNFDATYDASAPSVRHGFRNSVNLVFVRMMRDIERFYRWRVPGASATILEDPQDPQRQRYLARFADREGRQFVSRFYTKYQGEGRDSILHSLVAGRRLSPQRLAWAYRSVVPAAPVDDFEIFLRLQAPNSDYPNARVIGDLYRRADAGSQTLPDRGYLAGIHPLELWVARFLTENPGASRDSALAASADARQEVYRWLFSPRRRSAQDRSISVILELEAFLEIQRAWQRLGYPFENVVPSYGTAIGSSGDRPGALAELVGIILNGGVRRPTALVDGLRIAPDTPFETSLDRRPTDGTRVLSPEVADVARAALLDVVENGTARFVHGTVRGPGGEAIPIGGKTGTGNNQHKVFAAGGRLVEARTINRTATFVFFIGDRHFGVVTAHVPGPDAAAYTFTSALPVRVLALLGPALAPLVTSG